MKTNINTDNYEAYLLDYMEGNLSPDEAEQLKAFVVAQGLDWDELTEELPHLETPAIAYDGKETLKKKGAIMPLYAKIASAAAAAGLLLTVTLWPEKSLPTLEPVAELKPILPTRLITSEEQQTLPPRTISFVAPQNKTKKQPKTINTPRAETTLLADLQPRNAEGMQITLSTSYAEDATLDLIAYNMNTHLALGQHNEDDFINDTEDKCGLSLIGKGIYWLTDGRYDSFGSILSSSLTTAKKEISLAATDIALTAYYRTDEHFEEVKERWQEKREE